MILNKNRIVNKNIININKTLPDLLKNTLYLRGLVFPSVLSKNDSFKGA